MSFFRLQLHIFLYLCINEARNLCESCLQLFLTIAGVFQDIFIKILGSGADGVVGEAVISDGQRVCYSFCITQHCASCFLQCNFES